MGVRDSTTLGHSLGTDDGSLDGTPPGSNDYTTVGTLLGTDH